MEIQKAAEREMKRMHEVFKEIKNKEKTEKADQFYDFALNYYKDGCYFYKEKKYIEAFEAFIISWSYVDSGLKLGFFSVPDEQRKWFTA